MKPDKAASCQQAASLNRMFPSHSAAMAQLTAHRDLASLPLKLPMLTVSRRTWRPQRRGMGPGTQQCDLRIADVYGLRWTVPKIDKSMNR